VFDACDLKSPADPMLDAAYSPQRLLSITTLCVLAGD
jgi:hypothetical protein